MSDINEENIPKRILNLLKDDIAPEVANELVEWVSSNKKNTRVIIWKLYVSEIWKGEEKLSKYEERKVFSNFLQRRGYSPKSSALSKLLRACQIEAMLKEPIGTYKESALRPLTPLLSKGKERYITAVWEEVNRRAKGGCIKESMVKAVINSKKFSDIEKSKRGRKTKKKLSEKRIPFGITKNPKSEKYQIKLIKITRNLSPSAFKDVIKYVKGMGA
ncbi:MAG: hypothetical protein IPN27_12060 [Cellvibrionales bacterium]|nr:hypothetical protein [Cellvibrionales bacterium]